MTVEQTAWVGTRMQWLEDRVAAYPEKLQQIVEVLYLKNLLMKLPAIPKAQTSFIEFQTKTDKLLHLLPPADGAEAATFRPYTKELTSYKHYIQKTYNLIPKGYYKRIWLPLGIALGSCYGLLFKNVGIGLAFGVAIGVALGAGLDNKAEKENRVL